MPQIPLTDIPVDKSEFAVLDFETTGTSARLGRVIEIGIVKVKKMKITETFQSFINPLQRIPYNITVLTGITNSDVEDAPYFEDLTGQIIDFIGDATIVAHNLQFDYSFLKAEFERAEIQLIDNPKLCTLKLARKLYPELKSKSLGALTRSLKIRHKNVHRALGDSTVTAKLLIKMIKKSKDEFDIESLNDLINFQSLPVSKPNFRIIKKKLADDLVKIPETPGVYFFKDAKDNIIYIGKAKSLSKRVKNYFSNSAMRKAKKITRLASRLDFKSTNSELTALLAETTLIKHHNPRLNTMLKKYPQSYFIRVNMTHEYPNIEIVSDLDFDGNDYYGPYQNRDTAKTLVEIIDKTFLIRECKDKEFNKNKKCYLADIERCLAPCIIECKNDYKQEIQKMNDFLCGESQPAVDRLLNQMKNFSELQKFEQAAEKRDTVNLILKQLNRGSIISEPINRSNVLITVNETISKDYVLFINGRVIIKNDITEDRCSFDDAVEHFYADTISLFPDVGKKDLEQLKIALSWLVRNNTKVKIHYLKNYSSREELFSRIGEPKISRYKRT
ncbi:MAG: GIY-YIG nuclease family protein [Melioribacteraceae bacterium]|nr:GIY-YIG nuclease family protein [Melioribacteraceae bacterium]MCF8354650.1 GIY-YIG nuclease family protein [Melioribacteraceae bacterium]MCF8394175.1 GIY-YIG nuclease family protein [Melioribacteraceae bacterium]MCF8418858.1 GIY-YIG nuclease family protein [Melioribacteraceae bacterium]